MRIPPHRANNIAKNLRKLTALTAASLLVGLVLSRARLTPSEKPSSNEAKLIEAWRTSMAQIPLA
jgi:hypothetical protein